MDFCAFGLLQSDSWKWCHRRFGPTRYRGISIFETGLENKQKSGAGVHPGYTPAARRVETGRRLWTILPMCTPGRGRLQHGCTPARDRLGAMGASGLFLQVCTPGRDRLQPGCTPCWRVQKRRCARHRPPAQSSGHCNL